MLESRIPKNVEDWSLDGRWMVFNEAVPNNSDDLVAFRLDTREPLDLPRTKFQEDKGRFSPDGKRLAYQSDESGRAEVYVQPFPPTGEKWKISNDHGGQPQWRADGKELYYSTFTTPARMMAVDIAEKDHTLQAGIPRVLFEAVMQNSGARNRWAASRDGQKFLVVVPVNEKPVLRLQGHRELALAIEEKGDLYRGLAARILFGGRRLLEHYGRGGASGNKWGRPLVLRAGRRR